MEDRHNDAPLDAATIGKTNIFFNMQIIPFCLGLVKLSIVNYSQVIKLKPEDADGYYQRACLFEAENVSIIFYYMLDFYELSIM
jgi:hypothetical protein